MPRKPTYPYKVILINKTCAFLQIIQNALFMLFLKTCLWAYYQVKISVSQLLKSEIISKKETLKHSYWFDIQWNKQWELQFQFYFEITENH